MSVRHEGDGSPEQILAKAREEFKKHPPINAMIVAWYSRNDNGTGTMRYLHTEVDGPHLTALLSDLDFENHIARRSMFGRYAVDAVYPMKDEPIEREVFFETEKSDV